MKKSKDAACNSQWEAFNAHCSKTGVTIKEHCDHIREEYNDKKNGNVQQQILAKAAK